MSRLPSVAAILAAVDAKAVVAETLPIQPLFGMTDPEIEAAISKLAAQEGKVDDTAHPELQSESQFMALMTNTAPSNPSEAEPSTECCGDGDCGVCCG